MPLLVVNLMRLLFMIQLEFSEGEFSKLIDQSVKCV